MVVHSVSDAVNLPHPASGRVRHHRSGRESIERSGISSIVGVRGLASPSENEAPAISTKSTNVPGPRDVCLYADGNPFAILGTED